MKRLRSLHAKILLGYCLIGGIFMALITSALVQFRGLEEELTKQKQVVVFYDAVRNARRLEKNFLIYRRIADLKEAVDQTNTALDALDDIRTSGRWVNVTDLDKASVTEYCELLTALLNQSFKDYVPKDLMDRIYAVGSTVLKFGELLDEAAEARVTAALSRHDTDLLRAIWVALTLALVTGILVTRSVVRPLRDIELSLQRVAKGEVGRVIDQEAGREVESLTRSINDTIHKLEIRQETQARSSRLMALGTMLSGVAHELNNPLSNISSSCQILQEEWDELPAQSVRQLLGQIDHQVLRAERIVSALLDFSGDQVLRCRRENLRALVEEALQHVQFQIRRAVPVEISIDGVQEINVDRMRFQQVLVNIIKNAAEAIGPDGTVAIRAKREVSAEGWRSILEIEDDGPGIPVEYLTRVFDPFYTTKEVGKGTGLGLSVAYEIVTQHGGLLTANSGQKSGTCFHIEIPDVTKETKNSG